jgi:hypothetical protein
MSIMVDIASNKLFVPITSAIIGGIITYLFTKIRDKIKIFSYQYDLNRVAVSTHDALFGNVQVIWQGNEVPNLYLASFVIENTSFTDFESIKLKFWCGPKNKILQDNISLADTTFPIKYTDEYSKAIEIPEGQHPLPEQVNLFRSTRDFMVPVFNRGDKITAQILFLSEDEKPNIWLDIEKKGVQLKRRFPQYHYLGIPITVLLPWAFFWSIVIISICCLYVKNLWIIAFGSFLIGAFAQIIGAFFYKLYRKILHLISF